MYSRPKKRSTFPLRGKWGVHCTVFIDYRKFVQSMNNFVFFIEFKFVHEVILHEL